MPLKCRSLLISVADLKSAASNGVRVQVPPRALLFKLDEVAFIKFQIKRGI